MLQSDVWQFLVALNNFQTQDLARSWNRHHSILYVYCFVAVASVVDKTRLLELVGILALWAVQGAGISVRCFWLPRRQGFKCGRRHLTCSGEKSSCFPYCGCTVEKRSTYHLMRANSKTLGQKYTTSSIALETANLLGRSTLGLLALS